MIVCDNILINNKLSKYIIFSKQLNKKKDRILYSTRSNKLLLISESVYNAIKSGNFEKIPKNLLLKLYESNILVDKDENELFTVINENKNKVAQHIDRLYEVIQPTADCNLSCTYCGQTHSNVNMSDEIIDRIVDRIIYKIKTNKFKELTIGWFGGEPLMAMDEMMIITEKLKKFCDLNSVKYSAIVASNGLLLTKGSFEILVDKLNVRQIEITIDGTAPYHNNARHTKENLGSFESIVLNLREIVKLRNAYNLDCEISIRCNVNKYNVEGVQPLLKIFKELNLHTEISFYVKGIYSWAQNNADKDSLDRVNFAKKEINWIKNMIKMSYPVRINIPKRTSITCIATSPSSNMYDALGNIFICSETSYSKIYEKSIYHIGNLNDFIVPVHNHIFNNWQDEIIYNNTIPCKSCKFFPVCGGACPKAWKEGKVPCPSFRYNLSDKLKLKYLISQQNSNN